MKWLNNALTAQIVTGAVAFASVPALMAATADPYQGSYQWTDADGELHESLYLDPAYNQNQMKALVASVFADKKIPGTKTLITSSNGSTSTVGNYELRKTAPSLTSSAGYQFYSHYNGFTPIFDALEWEKHSFIGSSWETADVTPEVDGLTALLVEMVNDYDGSKIETNDFDGAWSKIKSVQVIPVTRQMHVDGQNPGYLLNLNQPLNKFFIALKGDLYSRTSNSDGYPMPFWNAYEQLSACDGDGSASVFVEDAYPTMLENGQFFVDHNCYSVLTRGHSAMMNKVTDTTPVHANMLIYIPDKRFVGQASDLNHYNTNYRPYYFIYNINLSVPQEGVVETDGDAVSVTANWTSTLKSITKDTEYERFHIQRSYDGGSTWTDVPVSDILSTNAEKREGDNTYFYRNASDVTVQVKETKWVEEHEVQYRVLGRLADSQFDEVVSNRQSVIIPGIEKVKTEPAFTIAVDHRSDFSLADMKNYYVNSIHVLRQADFIRQLRGVHVGESAPVVITLKRFTNVIGNPQEDVYGPEAKAETVATITLTKNSATDYTASIAYASGRPVENVSLTADSEESELYLKGDNTTSWLELTDEFEYDLRNADTADGNKYEYRIFIDGIQNAIDSETGDPLDDYTFRSTPVVGATMPMVNHAGGFNTYTLDEIKGDHALALEPSTLRSVFKPVSSDLVLKSCEVLTAVGNRRVMTANYTRQQYWEFYNFINGAMASAGSLEAGQPEGRVEVDPRFAGETVYMLITTTAGNTYGAPAVKLPKVPVLKIENENITYADGRYTIVNKLSLEDDDEFLSNGYGVWTKRDVRYVDNPKLITDLRHHRYMTDAFDLMTFSYADAWDADDHDDLPFSEAAAQIVSHYDAPQGTPSEPHYKWFRVRNYAKFVGTDAPVSRAAAADEYVVTEESLGLAHNGDTVTGVEGVVDGEGAVKVYPTITTGDVTVESEGAAVVYDMQGSVVLTDNGTGVRTLNFSGLRSGMYLITVEGTTVKVITK